ncbi:MAG: hypothetical protein IIA54_02345 [Chloroflexi bacterium]|nr:hypothetical protein [Chloroflexota bacterium]
MFETGAAFFIVAVLAAYIVGRVGLDAWRWREVFAVGLSASRDAADELVEELLFRAAVCHVSTSSLVPCRLFLDHRGTRSACSPFCAVLDRRRGHRAEKSQSTLSDPDGTTMEGLTGPA